MPLEGEESGLRARIRKYILRSLSHQDHTRAALSRKLHGKGFPDDAIQHILSECVRQGILNDQRFAERFVHASLNRKGYAPARIRRELLKQGVPAQIASQVLETVDEEPLRRELRSFLEAVRTRQHGPVSGEEGRRALELAERVAAGMEEHGRKVAAALASAKV